MRVKTRAEMDSKFMWDLSSIVSGEQEFKRLLADVQSKYKRIAEYKGKLSNRNHLLECLKLDDEISIVITNLYIYSKMRLDENAADAAMQSLCDRAEQLSVKISTIASYITPELSAADESYLVSLLSDKAFSDYDYIIKDIIRQKKHILSDKEERILAETKSFADGFHDAFNMFDNVDIKFDSISNPNTREKMPMSHSLYGIYLQDENVEIRRRAISSMLTAFKDNINLISQLYGGNVKKDCFYARVRGYESALEKSLASENIDPSVYYTLIKEVEQALPILGEYLKIRARFLSLKKLSIYDMHVSIFSGVNLAMPYDKAYNMVTAALAPLGEEYKSLLSRAYNDKWIDVYENKNKRSGAYSWGSYTSHPYVLLNYTETTHDVFTIAHELGHAMHSHYSNQTQPYAKAGYEIFVAEVASTVNEVLLLKYLMNNTEVGSTEYKFYASYYMDMFRTTVFRQTQFAEFEMLAHDAYEKDEPLTADTLSNIYLSLQDKYYPDVADYKELKKYEWARIPHFYRSFYVYKYATGLISAVSIATAILSEGDKAVERYKQFLSLGGSMSPVDILKVAGVDLTSDAPYKAMIAEMKFCIDALSK